MQGGTTSLKIRSVFLMHLHTKMLFWSMIFYSPGHVIEAKYIDGNEKKLDGPVPHDHFPPKVESKMPVICQEVWMSHCSPVDDAS